VPPSFSAFSSLIIGIWAAAFLKISLRSGLNAPFSSLIIGIWAAASLDAAAWVDGMLGFQFPHHRDLGCSARNSSPGPSPTHPFSSLIIGIWAAATLRARFSGTKPGFQFPHHRDLGCSPPFFGETSNGATFQFPHHRDLGCSMPGPLHACWIRNTRFQFPHHRDLGCSDVGILDGAWPSSIFQFPHHRDLGCSGSADFVVAESWLQLSVPSS